MSVTWLSEHPLLFSTGLILTTYDSDSTFKVPLHLGHLAEAFFQSDLKYTGRYSHAMHRHPINVK